MLKRVDEDQFYERMESIEEWDGVCEITSSGCLEYYKNKFEEVVALIDQKGGEYYITFTNFPIARVLKL